MDVHLLNSLPRSNLVDSLPRAASIHLLNSPPRGNLVGGLPRAASLGNLDNYKFFIVLSFDEDHFARDKSLR